MRLIGITGKAGSGKTTFSNGLAQKESIGVIHIDDIWEKIKRKYFKIAMESDGEGSKTKANSKLKLAVYKNKIFFRLFMALRSKLMEKDISKEINRLENMGKRVIIIDDIFLQYQKCYKDISLVFLMERPYLKRKNSLIERDHISKEEVVIYDMAHTSGSHQEKNKNKNIIRINNNKGKEELLAEVEKIYNFNFAPLRKRYRVYCQEADGRCERTKKVREQEER